MLTRAGRLDQLRISEGVDGGADSFLGLNEFGLEQLELEPNRPEFLPIQELQVLIRSTIGRGPWLLIHGRSFPRDRAGTAKSFGCRRHFQNGQGLKPAVWACCAKACSCTIQLESNNTRKTSVPRLVSAKLISGEITGIANRGIKKRSGQARSTLKDFWSRYR